MPPAPSEPTHPSHPDGAAPPSGPERSRELTRALGALLGGTLLLLAAQLLHPPLAGLSQLGLALLLLHIPGWVMPRDVAPARLGCALGWGGHGESLRLGLLALAAVVVPFVMGFQWVHKDLLGRSMDWSLSHLPRWNTGLWGSPEDLEFAPEVTCGRDEALIWTQPRTLWVMAPRASGLRVTAPATAGHAVVCTARGPTVRGQPVRMREGVEAAAAVETDNSSGVEGRGSDPDRMSVYAIPPGHGLVLTLGDRETLDLRLRDEHGQPLPADRMALGSRGVEASEDGRVTASRDLWWLVIFLAIQLGLVALPEEHFFRGYLQGRLDHRWGTPWRLLGTPVGWGLPVASLAFALLHPILIPGVDRLLVFFPSLLFGWLRARQGALGAAVIAHAGANLMLAVAARMVGQTPMT
jgi:hypothetical protein